MHAGDEEGFLTAGKGTQKILSPGSTSLAARTGGNQGEGVPGRESEGQPAMEIAAGGTVRAEGCGCIST